MRLRFGTKPHNPIAIDLGWSSTKLLQLGSGCIEAADEIVVPNDAGDDLSNRLDLLAQSLPRVLGEGSFRGRRVVLAMPAFQTVLQAMHLDAAGESDDEIAMHMQLPQQQADWMVRAIDVSRDGGSGRDVICQAISRTAVLRHVELLHDMKLEIAGIMAQPRPIVAAFKHVMQRAEDAAKCTVYVDIGASGATAVMAHGQRIVLARTIATGGRHFDACIAQALHCSPDAARDYRLAMPDDESPTEVDHADRPVVKTGARATQSTVVLAMDRRCGSSISSLGPELAGAPASRGEVDCALLIESLVDDLQLCLRHHTATWPKVPVSRVIFTGGEARQSWLCRQLVQALQLPGQVGDPLARLWCADGATPLASWPDGPRPDWTVVAGLAALHAEGGRHAAE